MSYNNIQDANAALNIVAEFDEPFCVGLKHMNPCGAAVGRDIAEAWRKAYEADKVSIFGGIVACNREITAEAAEATKPVFLEIVMAPSFSPEALDILTSKKNLRLIEVDMTRDGKSRKQYVGVNGGMLVQDADSTTERIDETMCVTRRRPTAAETADADFAWRIVKHVKSNAIVVVRGRTYGRRRCRTDEPRGLSRHSARTGRRRRLRRGSRARLRRVLPLRRYRHAGRPLRRHDARAARRQRARRGLAEKADELGMTMFVTGVRHFKH